MQHLQPASIRPFIGAKDYSLSRQFYTDLGFTEYIISKEMSYFSLGTCGFYLQDYYVKDWIDNSMVFLEVKNLADWFEQISQLGLEEKYKTQNVRIKPIHYNAWGNEFFIHDPAGILWHVGEFNTSAE